MNESQDRLRIERDKKEHDEMIERGDELVNRSTHLEKTVEASGSITSREMAQVSAIEKLAKKIRNQLGGDDDDNDTRINRTGNGSMSATEAVKSLRTTSAELQEELKKPSRFTISAAAIERSNEVIRLVRYLRSSI
jgi:hypothetical protein